MATFNIVLDKRTKLKEDKYSLAVRMVNGNDVMYINVQKMTESEFDRAFNKKVKDKETREFLDTCNGYISKCEKIFSELQPFNKESFRKRFWETDNDKPKSLVLSELFDYYTENKENIKPTTIDSLRYTKNRFENFKAGASVGDVTVSFLRKFEKSEVVKSKTKNVRRAFDYKTRKYNKWIIVIDYHLKNPIFYSAVHYIDEHGLNAIRVNADLRYLTHFTPHFLERYNERFLEHEELSKLDLLKRFIAENPIDAISYFPQDHSRNTIFCRFKEGIGLGDEEILSEKGQRIVHFRTYITNEMKHEGQLTDFNLLGVLYDHYMNGLMRNSRRRA